LALVAACCALGACALTSKSDPLRPRYFTPESVGAEAPAPAFGPSRGPGPELRLGRITASANLREPIVYRRSATELGYYDDRRWTERPETYLRRALANALFEQRGLTRAVSGQAPTLEVELVAFEEVRGASHKARLQAIAILIDRRLGRLERTITVERPVAGKDDDIDAVVRALAEALQIAVGEISQRVVEQVAALAPAEPPAGAPPPSAFAQ
jgi:cholesterol transport system auxiliary component